MKILYEEIKNRKPIKVYIKGEKDINWTDLGIYEYNNEREKYEGVIGNITIENILKWSRGNKELNHLKIETI